MNRTKSYIRNVLVSNKGRAFGASPAYVPAMVEQAAGNLQPALFTQEQIAVAIERARANPEDAPRPSWVREQWERFWFST